MFAGREVEMSFYIIIRGPLGIGKTTIAEALSKKIQGEHIAYDRILEEHDLEGDKEEGFISQKNFLKANEIAVSQSKEFLDKGTPIVFDGNFYWKSQVEDLISKLDYPHYVFTLSAPLGVCIERDDKRNKSYGKGAAEVVYGKTTEFNYGTVIDTNCKTAEEVVDEIKERLG